MSKYENYDILEEDNFNRLAVRVSQAIDDGWEPMGGVSVTIIDGQQYFYQAVALRKPNA